MTPEDDDSALASARRRYELLADASGVLARSLDFDETLATVARLTVPAYADWCFVELLRPDGGIERVLTEHADPAKRRFVEEYDRRYPLDPDAPVGSPHVIRTGEPVRGAVGEHHPRRARIEKQQGRREDIEDPLEPRELSA